MSVILTIIILTGAAGSCIPLGGIITSFERIHSNWLEKEFRHFIIAFGGGILYLIFQDIALQSRLSKH